MKLCFVANANSAHTRRWLRYFVRQGHQVTLVSYQKPARSLAGVTTHDLTRVSNTPKWRFLAWAWHLRQILRQLQPDLLHVHQVTASGWLGWLSGYHPLVVMPWGSDLLVQARESPLGRGLGRLVLRAADLVLADSKELVARAVALGARQARSHLVQWGVELDTFYPAPSRRQVRQRLDLPDAAIVLSPRSLHPIYRHEDTVAAIPLVRAHVPDVLFAFREFGPESPGYRTLWWRKVRELGVERSVVMIGEIGSRTGVADLYRAASLVVSVPVSDATSASVLEAMASGAPVVASDLPSVREWIRDEQEGLLVPVGDVNALAAAIVRLLTDPELYASIQTKARLVVEERADHEQCMERVSELYATLIADRSAGDSGQQWPA